MARNRRRLLWATVAVAVVVAGALSLAPTVRWLLRGRLIPRLEQSLGVTLAVSDIDLRAGRVELSQVTVTSAQDTVPEPLATIARVHLGMRLRDVLWGRGAAVTAELRDPQMVLVQADDGRDNFSVLLKTFQAKTAGSAGDSADAPARGRFLRIKELRLVNGSARFSDQRRGIVAEVRQLELVFTPGQPSAVRLIGVTATSRGGAVAASAQELRFLGDVARQGKLAPIALVGGELQLLPQLRLTEIDGSLIIDLSGDDAQLTLEFAGSYGGARTQLWSAAGVVQPQVRRAELELTAEDFSFGRIATILAQTPVIDFAETTVGGRWTMALDGEKATGQGAFSLARLNLFHPQVARVPLTDLSLGVTAALTFDLARGELSVEQLALNYRDVQLQLSGVLSQLYQQPQVTLQLSVPPVACQRVLDALPPALVASLRDFRLRGQFAADIHAAVDYAHLATAKLSGHVGINRCHVIEAPAAMSAARLREPFEQRVEILPGVFSSVIVGPENAEFVRFADVSPHVVNALMTTEDPSFFRHRGFVPSQFSEALGRNLERGQFRIGASTITMQMVKNVLLTHEKTIARKLQELFLTWYLERELSKDRIMEIYLNVIELGPDVIGVGAAARHLFDKSPLDISPLEAAFLASVLPSPKRRYAEYCRGSLSPAWKKRVLSIVERMYARGRLLEDEYAQAKEAEVVFVRDFSALSEADCLAQVAELSEMWRAEYYRRLQMAVMQAAPERVSDYLPAEFRP